LLSGLSTKIGDKMPSNSSNSHVFIRRSPLLQFCTTNSRAK
jgi:hypothetical protein